MSNFKILVRHAVKKLKNKMSNKKSLPDIYCLENLKMIDDDIVDCLERINILICEDDRFVGCVNYLNFILKDVCQLRVWPVGWVPSFYKHSLVR